MKRIICAVLCALLLVVSLTGCLATLDAQSLIKGNLDVIYFGEITDEYMEVTKSTREELEQVYLDGLKVEAEYFAYYFQFDMDLAPEDTMDRIVELYKDIYSHSKYEVGEAVKSGDDYLVSVTIHPIDAIYRAAYEEWAAFEEEFVSKASQLASMTDEEVEKLWVDSVFELVEGCLATNGYLEPQTISVQVVRGEDKVYSMSENDFGRIDSLIIQY